MRLIANGTTIRITHMGPNFLLIDSTTDCPAGEAMIYMRVDDNESEWKVRLPHGISADSKRVALALSE